MSTYAISDLHGYPLKKLLALLKKVRFSRKDTLYIIGDVIDRNGDGGVEMLQYIMRQPNYKFILGNHEDMLLACAFLFDEGAEESDDYLSLEHVDALARYLRNGGGVTIDNLREREREAPGTVERVLSFLKKAPLYASLSVNGREFLLVHGGLGGFAPDKKLEDYEPMELLWERPSLDTEYFKDAVTVFGHTPTLYYGQEHTGKVIVTDTWINIDAGAASCLPPALLRLDDLEVFYGS